MRRSACFALARGDLRSSSRAKGPSSSRSSPAFSQRRLAPGSTSRRSWLKSPATVPIERIAAAIDCRDAIAAWLEYLGSEKRASPHTVAAYCGDLARFCDFLAGHLGAVPDLAALAGLRAGDFRAYLAHRAGAGMA